MVTFGDVCREIFHEGRYTDTHINRPPEMYSQGELFPMEVYKEMHQVWRKKRDEEYQQYIDDVMEAAMKSTNFPFRADKSKSGDFDTEAFCRILSKEHIYEFTHKDLNEAEEVFEEGVEAFSVETPEGDWFEGFADPDDIDYSHDDDEDEDDDEDDEDYDDPFEDDDWDDDEDLDEDD